MSFADKTVAITGAANGIGKALALRLATDGAKLALCDIDEASLNVLGEMLQSMGTDVTWSIIDVRDKDAMSDWAKATNDHFGSIDYLFNNAGVCLVDYAQSQPYDDIKWVMDVNFWGVVHGCTAFLPYMQRQQHGHIINISSILGIITVPSQSAYSASKFAVKGYSEALSAEMKKNGITVSCVHPGGIKTDFVKHGRINVPLPGAKTIENTPKVFKKMARSSPEHAANVILNGVTKKKTRILIGGDAWFMDKLQRLMPSNYLKLIGKVMGKSKNSKTP